MQGETGPLPEHPAEVRGRGPQADGQRTQIGRLGEVASQFSPELAYARGSATLAWVYVKDGKETAQSSRSIDLVLLARDSRGEWRIIRQMWSQLPP